MSVSPIQFIGVTLALLLIFLVFNRENPKRTLRWIKAFRELRHTLELSVEDGSRLHVSLGRGGLLGPESAAAFAGLTLLRQLSEVAADSDQAPVATTGDGAVLLLAQDTLRHTYRRLNILDQYHSRLARATGLTPFSYAGGTLPLIHERFVSASALAGSFGTEVGLVTAASQQTGAFTLGSSNTLNGQAVLYATAQQPLLGEELYAAGAYMGAGPAHRASLRTQDTLRWIIVALLIITAVVPLLTGLQ